MSHYRRASMIGQRVCGGLAVVAMVAVVMVVATAGTAHACSCFERDLADYADDISVAFAGSQVERTVHSEIQDNGAALVFSVDRVYKGEAGPLVEVRTHAQDSACGIDMARRGTVGVAAWERKGDLNVNLCGSIVPLVEMEGVFGEGYPPDESIRLPVSPHPEDHASDTSQPPDDGLVTSPQPEGSSSDQSLPAVLIVVGAVLIAISGAVIWHRRR